jgi:hypothetical protein
MAYQSYCIIVFKPRRCHQILSLLAYERMSCHLLQVLLVLSCHITAAACIIVLTYARLGMSAGYHPVAGRLPGLLESLVF